MIKTFIRKKTFSYIMSFLIPYLICTGCIKVVDEKVDVTLTASPTSLSFPSSGDQRKITVTSNDSWTYNKDEPWLTVSDVTGTEAWITAAANTSTSPRNATVTFSCSLFTGVPKKTVTVTQAGLDPILSVSSNYTETANNLNLQMIAVQGGTFTMGCTSEQGSDCYGDETPTHQVTLSDFHIGKYEVTQAQWKIVMNGDNPSSFKGDNLPVESVSWNEVQTFITKLNIMTGKQYRLPTEAEWEYAARGGRNSEGYKYSGSNTVGNVAWYMNNSGDKTHDVGTKSPNELGIYDMSGNVWEWCNDWYGSYSSSAKTNPQGPSSGSYRVFRGGSWSGIAIGARVSYRGGSSPGYRGIDLGFRLACSIK